MKKKFLKSVILALSFFAIGTIPNLYADDDAAEPNVDDTNHAASVSPVTGEDAEINAADPNPVVGEDATPNPGDAEPVTGEDAEVTAADPNPVVGEDAAPNVDVGEY